MVHIFSSIRPNYFKLFQKWQNNSTTRIQGLVTLGQREPLISSMWKWQKSSTFIYDSSLAGPLVLMLWEEFCWVSFFLLSPLWPCQAINICGSQSQYLTAHNFGSNGAIYLKFWPKWPTLTSSDLRWPWRSNSYYSL